MDFGTFVWHLQYYMFFIFDKVMLILGPVLVCLALSLICLVTYTFFTFVLPLLVGVDNVHGLYWWLFTIVGTFLLFNIVFNYINCVRTDPGTHKGKLYARLLREAKAAGNVNSPSSESEEEEYEIHDASGPLLEKTGTSKRRGPPISPDLLKQYLRSSGGSNTNGSDTEGDGINQADAQFVAQAIANKSKSWVDLGDNEWSVCKNSGKLKPPRAHYDHVTKNLVLNMDHYCPWMANVVGYGNYRYFFLFLLYMFLGAGYAAGTAAVPFLHLQSHGSHGRMKLPATLPVERTRLRGYTPAAAAADADHTTRRMLLGEEVPLAGYDKRFFSSSAAQEILLKQKAERERDSLNYKLRREGNWYVMFTFILTLSVSIAVWLLLAWHIYLVFTAQTTIEFHGNRTKWSRLKAKGILYRNPYDLGWRKNWQQVFGTGNPLVAILPSTRPPPWPPWPQHKWKDPSLSATSSLTL